MATLRDYFDTDFARVLNTSTLLQSKLEGEIVEFPVRVHLDFDANAKFLSCYLPASLCSAEICNGLLDQINELLTIGSSVEIHNNLPGEDLMKSADLYFSGRFFIYHETEIDEKIQKNIRERAHGRNVFVQFRGPQFALQRTRIEKPAAFISHDSRDKVELARPIAIGLSKLMCPVWYDDFSLKVGSRIRESIEQGLKEARKCVLIITPNFLSNTGWTKAEFNGIFTRELVEGKDVVLPVWHGVSREEVYEYSPVLADRLAVDFSVGLDETVRKLRRAIND